MSYHVLNELFQTEKDYCQNLEIIIIKYMKPLKIDPLFKNLVLLLFSNIEELLEFSKKLLKLFEADLSIINICEILTAEKNDFINYYGIYCSNFPLSSRRLEQISENQNLNDNLEDIQKQHGHTFPLSSMLLKPVQRILKYELLLKSLLSSATKENISTDKIKDALASMSYVGNKINQMQFVVTGVMNLQMWAPLITSISGLSLESTGLWIQMEEFKVHEKKFSVTLILCEQIIFICKKCSPESKTLTCEYIFRMDKLNIFLSNENQSIFYLSNSKKFLILQAKTTSICSSWFETIKNTKKKGCTSLDDIMKSAAKDMILSEERAKSILNTEQTNKIFKDVKEIEEFVLNQFQLQHKNKKGFFNNDKILLDGIEVDLSKIDINIKSDEHTSIHSLTDFEMTSKKRIDELKSLTIHHSNPVNRGDHLNDNKNNRKDRESNYFLAFKQLNLH